MTRLEGMQHTTWGIITQKMHEEINKKGETLYLSIFSDSAFHFDCYIELRKSKRNGSYIIYHSTMGTRYMQRYFIELMSEKYDKRIPIGNIYDEFISTIDYRPFIREQSIKNGEFEEIQNIMLQNQLPSKEFASFGLDGHWIVFHNYFGEETIFVYWSKPPQKYSYLQTVTNILADYLPKTERNMLKRDYDERARRQFPNLELPPWMKKQN